MSGFDSSKYGEIIVTRVASALGAPEELTYRWQGGPLYRMDFRNVNGFQMSGDIFSLGPYRLKKLNPTDLDFYIDLVRMDYPFWWWLVFVHRSSRILRIIWARIIITLAVWRLAKYQEAMIPSYKDIYLVEWFLKLFHQDKR